MNEVSDLRQLEAGLLSNQQIDQLITTNRALHAVVLELKGLIQTTARQHGTRSVEAPGLQDLVFHRPTDDQPVALIHTDALADFHLPEGASAINEKAAIEATVEQSKADFDHDNEQARRRHERRRQQEILRLKNRVSYKCK